MAAPPLFSGAVQLTAACMLPATATTAVGGSGTVIGVTARDGADGKLGPARLVATTVNVYGVPLVRPVTMHVRPTVVVQGTPPPEDVAV
jgi:hypothetical protein